MGTVSTLDKSAIFENPKSNRSILLAAKGGVIVFAGALFSSGSQLLIGILLTRFLGTMQFGLYRVAVTTGQMVAGFALLGMEDALVRYISLYASRDDKARVWGTIQVGVGVPVLLGVVIGAGLYAVTFPLALNLFHEPRLVPLLRLACMIPPFMILSRVLVSATRGFNNMRYATVATDIGQPLIRMTLTIALVLVGLTALTALIPFIAGLIVSSILLVYFLNRLFPLRCPIQTARRNVSEMLHFSLPAYFSTLLDTFGPNLQTVLLGSLNTIATVGIFGAAAQISTIGSLFNQSIGTASSPIVSELHGRGMREQMAYFYQTTTKWMFAANLPFCLIVLLLSNPILAIFGREFKQGSHALIILAVANLVIAAAGVSDGVLAMTGNTKIRLVNSMVFLTFTIILGFQLIPRWGAIGAAFGVLVSASTINLLRVSEVFLLFRMVPYNRTFVKPAIAGFATLLVCWLTRQWLPEETKPILAAATALEVIVVYIVVNLLLGLAPEDRAVFIHCQRRVSAILGKK